MQTNDAFKELQITQSALSKGDLVECVKLHVVQAWRETTPKDHMQLYLTIVMLLQFSIINAFCWG